MMKVIPSINSSSTLGNVSGTLPTFTIVFANGNNSNSGDTMIEFMELQSCD